MTGTWTPTVQNCDNYMDERTGKYEYRAIRYRHAIDAMYANGFEDGMTVFDVGAGMTEFARCLFMEYGWNGRYIPIDGGIGGEAHDLNRWVPNREAHWVVALEILEHLAAPTYIMKYHWKPCATEGVVFSTPNPRTTDVIAMDPTHISVIHPGKMEDLGFAVTEETFYGGLWSNGEPDSLFGIWRKDD